MINLPIKKLITRSVIVLILLVLSYCSYIAWQLYPQRNLQPMPTPLVSLNSDAGRSLLLGAEEKADYGVLEKTFEPQVLVTFCGVASSVAVLNAMEHASSQFGFFTSDTAKVRTMRDVMFGGMSLHELAGMLEAHGVSADYRYAGTFELDTFRQLIRKNLANPQDFLLVNYQREVLEQGRVGHISPLAAYDEDKDFVLLLDTASHKYPPTWIPLPLLFKAMHTKDNSSGKMRGFVEVRKWK